MDGYRRELKYIVTDDVLSDVKNRIIAVMRADQHQTGDFYKVRSLYFDSPSYTCLEQNRAGVSTREKYRIRTYDCSGDTIVAEIKIRHRDTISKMSTRICRELFDVLAKADTVSAVSALTDEIGQRNRAADGGDGIRVLEKYLARIATESYRPACTVDYERSAYIYDIANVRITFDRNVFSSVEFERFFDPALTGRPALEANRHILEIKYDEFLPDVIKEVLGGMKLKRSSSSKYAQCMANYRKAASYGE